MDTKEKVELAKQILGQTPSQNVRILNNDNSLLERKGASIILTQDNRELLRD